MDYSGSQNAGHYYRSGMQLSAEEQAQLESVYGPFGLAGPSAPADEYHEAEDEMKDDPSEAEQLSPEGSTVQPQGSNVKHQRQQKRREQNKTAQRNFRKRKEEHLSTLTSKIEALELQRRSFEAENQELLHELVRKRAENISLRSSRRFDHVTTTAPLHRSFTDDSPRAPVRIPERISPPSSKGKQKQTDPPDSSGTRPHLPSPLPIETLMTLYGPFLEVWKQIRAQPAVASGQAGADAVLDRLREMAKYEDEESLILSNLEGGVSAEQEVEDPTLRSRSV